MKNQTSLKISKNYKTSSIHGGSIKNPQKIKRPLSLKSYNHFVLKSSKAKKAWSFRRHKKSIDEILRRFASKHHIGLVSYVNVGSHIHLKLEISNRKQYKRYIRAISSAIMMKVTGFSRWNKAPEGFQFWDFRPFSRVVTSWKEKRILKEYFLKNSWESYGYSNYDAKTLQLLAGFRGMGDMKKWPNQGFS